MRESFDRIIGDKLIMDEPANIDIWSRLQIRYVKLHFHLRMLEDSILPKHKVSALRGGMGEMLLRANCIRDRKCENCDFASECIVRRMMYSQMEIQPEFMKRGDSVGYVLECENYEEHFTAGEELTFQLILFGRNIVYFNQYLQAFAYLGMQGIGKYRSRYVIEHVTNTQRDIVVEGDQVYKKNYVVQTVEEYVRYRMQSGQTEDTIVFHTPAAIRHRGQMMDQIDADAVMASVIRRIYILDCFEGIAAGKAEIAGHIPAVRSQKCRKVSVERYSSTHDEKIRLTGICGSAVIEIPDEMAWSLLYAGELIHIGKNTSFGFGRYSLSKSRGGEMT